MLQLKVLCFDNQAILKYNKIENTEYKMKSEKSIEQKTLTKISSKTFSMLIITY